MGNVGRSMGRLLEGWGGGKKGGEEDREGNGRSKHVEKVVDGFHAGSPGGMRIQPQHQPQPSLEICCLGVCHVHLHAQAPSPSCSAVEGDEEEEEEVE